MATDNANKPEMIPVEVWNTYTTKRDEVVEQLRNRTLPKNENITYGQLISDDELRAIANNSKEVKPYVFSVYPEETEFSTKNEEFVKNIYSKRIAPYNTVPKVDYNIYENMMERRPQLAKAWETYNSELGQTIRAEEAQGIYRPQQEFPVELTNEYIEETGDQPPGILSGFIDINRYNRNLRNEPRMGRFAKAKEIAQWGVDPENVIDFEGVEDFQRGLFYLPRNMTKEDLDFYAKKRFKDLGLNISGDFQYINPGNPSLGIKFKKDGEDEYKIINSPFVEWQDVKEFAAKESPTIVGDLLFTIGGSKGLDKVVKGKRFSKSRLKNATDKWAKEMNYIDPGVTKRMLQIGGMSLLSATGAAGGDFLRLTAGKEKGYHDRTFDEVLKESALIGALAFAGTATVTMAIKTIPSIWKRFTGEELPHSFYQTMDDIYETLKRQEQGVSTGPMNLAYGPNQATNKEIREAIAKLADYTADEISEYTPSIVSALDDPDITANTLFEIFVRKADDPLIQQTFKDIQKGNNEVAEQFIRYMTDYFSDAGSAATGATVGETLKSTAKTKIDDIEAKMEEIVRQMQKEYADNVSKIEGGEGTLLLDDVLNPEASGSTLFIRTQKELDKILKQYKNTADEQYTLVKQKYNNLTTGAGYLRKPTSAWKNIKSGSNVVFGYKNKTAAADEFYNSIPRDLRIRLQGQSPTGGFAGKEEIKFTFEELDQYRMGLNKLASETADSNPILSSRARDLERGIEKQMMEPILEESKKRYFASIGEAVPNKKLTKSQNAAVENWRLENNYGVDLEDAWKVSQEARKLANSQLFKSIKQTYPERLIDTILATNTKKAATNTPLNDFLTVLKSNKNSNEIKDIQEGLFSWINRSIFEDPNLSSFQKGNKYRQFVSDYRGTLKTLYGDDFKKLFGTSFKDFDNAVLQLQEYDNIVNALRFKYAPNNSSAGVYNFVENILETTPTQKISGQATADVKELIKLVGDNQFLQTDIKNATLQWIKNTVTDVPTGMGTEVRGVNADKVIKLVTEGFGPPGSTTDDLTFEGFIKPLLFDAADEYTKQFRRFADMVSKNQKGMVNEEQVAESLARPRGVFDYVMKTWIPPLTQFGRRMTALTRRMGEHQRIVMAEMMLDPKKFKKYMDMAEGKIKRDAAIRFLVSYGSVASQDLANDMDMYDAEDLYVLDFGRKEQKRINVIEAGLPVPPGTLTRIMDIRRNAGQQ